MVERCWEPGQLYVALSRVRTVEGIHLLKKISSESLMTDQRVVDYYRKLKDITAA